MSNLVNSTIWLSYVKRLHAIAESGLAFSPEEFDRERFEEISQIARQMMSDLASVPVNQISDLVTPFHRRYVTPQVEVRGAVIKDNKILLVQEKSDKKWTLPGGYADVGLTAVENIKKEIEEEANVQVSHPRLISLRHKASGDYDPDIREFYKILFLCDPIEPVKPLAGMETCGADFFALDEIPPLSTGRTIMRDLQDAFIYFADQQKLTSID
ncbi:NUDIX hydrolase N-terminal domain-containing protein [Aliiglaciecola sp. 3_MG-2023]|uniref:NUDIX hydrolase N-terminal domain-containing protein n=1 Tax=Aliiglaciecola sp. 3_MG-2023 TaxID=3062644 RepID=UPI0026E18A14|nr:NUDIX hydrolase N-terminal domain-containing protein [Aliiglaciecola sp. 3_MG-2023]MDO6692460.1 NUDIX hydrolase N-terminal domain-containing protein [Aliiglaciecola sp. 3_MG-2023]